MWWLLGIAVVLLMSRGYLRLLCELVRSCLFVVPDDREV